MPKSMYGLSRTGKNPEIQSTELGELITVGVAHELVESGRLWTLNYREPSVANNGIARLLVKVGTNPLRAIDIKVTSGGESFFRTISNPTTTADGTAPGTNVATSKLSVFPRNPVAAVPLLTQFFHTPTYTAGTGQLRGNVPIHGGTGPFSTGSTGDLNTESQIAPGSVFMIEVTNISGSAQQIGIQIDMYEE